VKQILKPISLLLCLHCAVLLAQDIERYLGLINEGRIDDVRSALPELEALYKNDDKEYNENVVLEIDNWVLIPKKK